jgi:hypothetical protein
VPTIGSSFLNANMQIYLQEEAIILNELDKELENRRYHFVSYADEKVILFKSKQSDKRKLVNTIQYIEEKLFLNVNRLGEQF